jgi:hypothetical protein
MVALTRTKASSILFIQLTQVLNISFLSGLLDDPEIDAIYNPVRASLRVTSDKDVCLKALPASQRPPLRMDPQGLARRKTRPPRKAIL